MQMDCLHKRQITVFTEYTMTEESEVDLWKKKPIFSIMKHTGLLPAKKCYF